MAEIINLVSDWAHLAHRITVTSDQISGEPFIKLTFYSDDNKAIAAVNISADALPGGVHDGQFRGGLAHNVSRYRPATAALVALEVKRSKLVSGPLPSFDPILLPAG